ncbi:uncharacterized protein LOC123714981 isoform X1 [Pieris brassicae]|uniref:uncharacterized protein LOC123714981 isoform X1 n=2 Tax=Pieris brassicae TaxID=7116 RepID=UPI001E65F7E7|nr:uncharacterized protein LOC123714981 isoform X1 [Pieris brassicae]XP_045525665.1 uncharacterized protein LOC123714981 isoform X1 [Pieris brassicae]
MATWGSGLKDWDPMRDDYNDSMYDSQYPDENVDSGVQLDHHKLYVTNIPQTLSEEGLKLAFTRYGNVIKIHMSRDPKKRYAFIFYESPSEAKLALMKLNKSEPLKLNVAIAHKKTNDQPAKVRSARPSASYSNNYRDESSSVSSKGIYPNTDSHIEVDNMENTEDDESLSGVMNPELDIEFTKLQLRELEVQRREIQFQKKLLLLNCGKKETNTISNRTVTADGKIIFKNTIDRPDTAVDATFSGAGDSKDACSCQAKTWNEQAASEDSSTPSTCVVYSEDRSVRERKAKSDMTNFNKSDISDKLVKSVDFINKTDRPKSRCTEISKVSRKSDYSRFTEKSDVTSKKEVCKNVAKKSEISCDLKFDCDDENEDETNRMIQLRNADYMDIVDENLKIVIALAGYPKSKMRLKQMEIFQRSINDIMDMQLKQGLMKKTPLFLDYYLNRGAIVCICKDVETRDWMVRVSPGLQERMSNNLLLLKAKVKRLCVAVMKIPQSCWPSSAQDAFKLLQYFNPTLHTDQWKIYAQKIINNVECTSFLIDRISGEIIRGPTFRNIIDYSQMDFELTGFTEIYYDCFLSDMEEDLHSVASRVKLLEVIRSTDTTPRTEKYQSEKSFKSITNDLKEDDNVMSAQEVADAIYNERVDSAIDMEAEDVELSEPKESLVNERQKTEERKSKGIEEPWCLQTNCDAVQSKSQEETVNNYELSTPALSDKSESVFASSDNLVLSRSSNLNIDSNRGIAYHRRTNYLHVENELKIAITLQGYPQEKLEGNHIRRFKHLFKEYIHKDMKVHRFDNMIIPKFQDVYLSNGAVIYVCDSLETKDYLSEVLPKFVNSTGLKLIFREVQNLLRYTRLVMRLSKELAHVESLEILRNLQSRYPKLKPECWKYYSDVAGKQKRQFGVDPESLEIIKSPDFDPTYEGETLVFRIIDRQKKDKIENINESVICSEDKEMKKLRETITQNMYCPIHVANSSLTRIRANHYSDLVPDDLKLYVGPSNYPETRIDESVFQTIKRSFEEILVSKGEIDFDFPKIHDMYLFDGVIFIICKNLSSRYWIAESLSQVNQKGNINLKATEFRGAVGIVSLYLEPGKDADYVVSTLQNQNPRLRTKYWRQINTVRTKSKLNIVLQIDKLSAQVIMNKGFNGNIDNNEVTFKLGHLKSLINRKLCLDVPKSPSNKSAVSKKSVSQGGSRSPELHVDQPELNPPIDRLKTRESEVFFSAHVDIKSDSDKSIYSVPKASKHSYCKLNLRVPSAILPDHKDGLEMIFDLLQDKNPGLNTELWKVQSRYGRGAFKLMIDKQSASIIQSKEFDPTVGGEKLKFSL